MPGVSTWQRHSGIILLAALVSVLAGVFGAAGATRVGWEFAPPLAVDEVKRTVLPGLEVTGDLDAPLWWYGDDGELPQLGTATFTAVSGAAAPGVRERLVASGWKILDLDIDPAAAGGPPTEQNPVRAVRDGQVVSYGGGSRFTVRRAAPGSGTGQIVGVLAWPTVALMCYALGMALIMRPAFQSWPETYYARLLWMAGGPPRWVGLIALIAVGLVAFYRRPVPQPRTA